MPLNLRVKRETAVTYIRPSIVRDLFTPWCMSQSSSGLPDIPSPESPPLHEQGLLPDPATSNKEEETKMDTSQMVTAELQRFPIWAPCAQKT
ncbi:hypothetical protein CDAR_304421 [Caerostris darwini]|uniref:Uncharacterized protein n=1 Tax=Caerostris darwini TaxID=1538125 RepID=A0AAV4QZU4_9ARAC|nr:hypothetical protein CDAR_304421 [Caerostris darwini]